ncbi:TlpA family protein disulfide reductase [Ferruginibacter albus]|uniref:TlpA family protein disulfide reductase n=1 Tax=Ferruginibacter albus TaxID=2875540 RepID=UPI001CC5A540|nr:thioredoxin-like domain-containing protein [Ferruginibacter albus]UAY53579.1 thioredoxin family protein [Ferruginibacter albus]
MKTSIVSIAFALLFSTASFAQKAPAQNGYSITIDMQKTYSGKMYLSLYQGTYSKTAVIDSFVVSGSEATIKFDQPKRILGGIYQLSYQGDIKPDKNDKINIAVDNGAILHFTLIGPKLGALEIASSLNADYLYLQRVANDPASKKEKLQTLQKKYSTSIIALWATLELKKIASDELTANANKVQYRNNYFSNFNLQDKRLQILPNIYSALNDYMTILPVVDSNYQSNVDVLLKGMDCNTRNYTFYLDWIFKNIIYYQQKKLEKTYNYVYNRYLNSEDCKKADSTLYARITNELNRVVNTPIGSIIPSFKMSDSADNYYTIDSLKLNAPYSFIAFFDPDCPHCQEIMPKVSAFFAAANFKDSIQKIAFLNAPYDSAQWHSFIVKSKLEHWLNVKAYQNDTEYMIDLKLTGNPNFYLIDNTGKILLKSADGEMIKSVINKTGQN